MGYHKGVKNIQVNIRISIRLPTSLKNTLTDEKKSPSPIVNNSCNIITIGRNIIYHFNFIPKMRRNGIKTDVDRMKLTRLDRVFDIGRNSLGKYTLFISVPFKEIDVVDSEIDVLKKIQGR